MGIKKALHELTGNVFEFFLQRRKILRGLHVLGESVQGRVPGGGGPRLPTVDVMLTYSEQEMSRRRTIEEKAKTNALAMTLAFSAMLAVVAFAGNLLGPRDGLMNCLVWFAIGLHILGMLFLLIGGLLALGALRTVPTQMWTLEDDKLSLAEEEKASAISGFLEFNQRYTNLKSNHLETSYSCIRNGVMAFFGAALLGLMLARIPASPMPF